MKYIFRAIGIIVVLVVVLSFGLWFFNDRGYINPNTQLSKSITNVSEHILAIWDDITSFFSDMDGCQKQAPTPEPSASPDATTAT